MSNHPAFELIRDEQIAEVNSQARLYRHKKTGAEVLSLVNDDENKVFGITFKTPPEDSTGIAHILEHSVLCGSRKYPVKKPFVELLKGSLHTFLNAMTFPDKTAYPVASQNLKDFYNLVDVYLDAVYFPLISEDTFRQEGWHYELEDAQAPLVYKGVVFNEMKGVFSSPDAVMRDVAQRSLYPDVTYGKSSGGDPKAIPDLTYAQFKRFHEKFYHPSNTRAFFSGDDDAGERLNILDAYFSQFERAPVDAEVGLQPRFNAPRQIVATYAGTKDEGKARDGMVSLNWMIDPPEDRMEGLSHGLLSYMLAGNSAAPLRKALTDSGLGEGMTGGGIGAGLRQPMASFGMKGIDPADAGKVEALILSTLEQIATDGIDKQTVEAALNTFEFSLRENNTGSFPRGISMMFSALSTWLHGGDPLAPLAFEEALAALKAKAVEGHFEREIRRLFLDNTHRTTVTLSADPEQGAREVAEEKARLAAVRATMDEAAVAATIAETEKLRALQEAVDDPAQLAKIPALTLADLPRESRTVPIEIGTLGDVTLFYHDLPTLGIIYTDLGFDLHVLDKALLPYLPLFGRALLQTGTKTEDFVSLTQRIGRSTGGIAQHRALSAKQNSEGSAAWFFLSGKAVPDKHGEMLDIMGDVLLDARLDNRDRFKQMALEEKAGFEARLVPAGNAIVDTRLKSGLTEASWIAEQLGGVSYLQFLRELVKRIDSDWAGVQSVLETIRDRLFNRGHMVVNVTADAGIWDGAKGELAQFLGRLPNGVVELADWGVDFAPRSEGLVIPAQVNYVGKGANLKALGFELTAASSVALKFLNTTYLWDKVRVQGGAYGGSSRFDLTSGNFAFLSYRDPNLLKTLDAYDGAAKALNAGIGEADLTRSIIGVIGDIDGYQFPDAKGYSSMWRQLTGTTDAIRQQRRDEVLGASGADFKALAAAVEAVAKHGHVVVLGGEAAITAANDQRPGLLDVTKVM
ncbi:peptidase M16 [Devosia limi DSM 17137]|uniref:Peptidase M16 n=1 Tax=Devosia limi DSM 17137 TaxID=1121477 RepID=A0A0F5LK24_9HYPH|nr:insulinase family protein [Devosia limi]KKB82630.1 peptidase M16 [Devosia limi DSM 17137]SHE42240.1 pre-sequence protease. Metallo peptidase. MEROPS family M16C [Devosia limi DSM 17137]